MWLRQVRTYPVRFSPSKRTSKGLEKVSCSEVRGVAKNLCKRVALTSLNKAVIGGEAKNLAMFFSGKMQKVGNSFREIVSEEGSWQKFVLVYLEKHRSELKTHEPFPLRLRLREAII